MSKSINNIFVFKTNSQKASCNPQNLHTPGRPQVETLTVNHLKAIFNDKNPQACFQNAIE